MEQFTIYCTPEQTKKAFNLGAPIKLFLDGWDIPTAEQMIGWLLERIDDINILKEESGTWLFILYPDNSYIHQLRSGFSSRKEATLAAIDAALDYLSNK